LNHHPHFYILSLKELFEVKSMTDEIALKRWKALEPELRKKLESNVYCGKCGVTTIVDYDPVHIKGIL
jgi:hypothetical protein